MPGRRTPGHRPTGRTGLPPARSAAVEEAAAAGDDEVIPIEADADLGGYEARTARPETPERGADGKFLRKSEAAPEPAPDDTQTPEARETTAPAPETLDGDLGEPEPDGDPAEAGPGAAAPAAAAAVESLAKKPTRDYSIFADPDMEQIARALPNHLYEKFKTLAPRYKTALDENARLREAAQKVPSFHYEHPEGYMLAPEWPKLTQAFQAQQFEASHWERQLLNIENGEPWQDFAGYDQQGKPQYITRPAPTDGRVDVRARIAVQQALARANSELANTQAYATNFINSYSARRQQAMESVEQHQRKLFPNVDPEKLSGEDKQSYELAGKLISSIDESFARHPATEFTKRMYVVLQRVARQGMKWKSELDKANSKLSGKARAQNASVPSAAGPEESGEELIPIDKDDII